MLENLLSVLRDNAWNGIAGLVVLVGAIIAIYRSVRKRPILPAFVPRLLQWLRLNPRYVAFAILTAVAAFGSLAITGNQWSALILVAYASLLALIRSLPRRPTARGVHRFRTLSIDTITNAFLHDIYDHFPQGQLNVNGVPFEVTDSRYDTSQALASRVATIQLQPAIRRPIAAHFLINAGGARSEYRDTVAGRLTFRFGDEESFSLELVIGENIREWAIGNASPGLLVTDVASEAGTRIVWSGRNLSGNEAIIDSLPVTFPTSHRRFRLSQIDIVRDVGSGTSHGDLGFFISAVSIEYS